MNRIDGITLEVLLPAMIVGVGLFAWIISPILAFAVLVGAAGLLPISRKARTSLLIIGCISISLGAALATADLPLSQIAALKLHGSPYQSTISGGL